MKYEFIETVSSETYNALRTKHESDDLEFRQCAEWSSYLSSGTARLKHTIWGEGTVSAIDMSDGIVSVTFAAVGAKRLHWQHPSITYIDAPSAAPSSLAAPESARSTSHFQEDFEDYANPPVYLMQIAPKMIRALRTDMKLRMPFNKEQLYWFSSDAFVANDETLKQYISVIKRPEAASSAADRMEDQAEDSGVPKPKSIEKTGEKQEWVIQNFAQTFSTALPVIREARVNDVEDYLEIPPRWCVSVREKRAQFIKEQSSARTGSGAASIPATLKEKEAIWHAELLQERAERQAKRRRDDEYLAKASEQRTADRQLAEAQLQEA